MSLSEKRKKEIKQEEKYRSFVRSDLLRSRGEKKSGKASSFIKIVLAFSIIVILMSVLATMVSNNNPDINDVIDYQEQGVLGSYNYEILGSSNSNKYTASFEPFLTNNDKLLTDVMKKMILTTFNRELSMNHFIDNTFFADINGVAHILIQDSDDRYYFLPIKEDTSEIHSIIFWKD